MKSRFAVLTTILGLAFMGSAGAANASNLATKGAPRAVPFSRSVTAADTAFASTTVTFPRSSKVKNLQLASSVVALYEVQGNGVELFAGSIGPNVPAFLDLTEFPEATAITVLTEILAAGAAGGAAAYT